MEAVRKATGQEVMEIMKTTCSVPEFGKLPAELVGDVFAHLLTTHRSLTVDFGAEKLELIIGEPKYMASLVSNIFGGLPDNYVGGFGFFTHGDHAVKVRDILMDAYYMEGIKHGEENETRSTF